MRNSKRSKGWNGMKSKYTLFYTNYFRRIGYHSDSLEELLNEATLYSVDALMFGSFILYEKGKYPWSHKRMLIKYDYYKEREEQQQHMLEDYVRENYV